MNKRRWLWLPARAVQNILLAAAIATLSVFFTSPDSHPIPEFAPFYTIERAGYDFLFTYRGPKLDRIDPRIVVVGFDRASEQDFHTRWPAPRSLHAKIIHNLAKDGASLIVYDVLFSDASTKKQDDKALDVAIKEAGNVVFPMRIDRDYVLLRETLEEPYYNDDEGIDYLAKAVEGCAEVPQDNDGVVRRYTPFMYFQDQPVPSMSASAYLKLRGLDQHNLSIRKDGFQVGDVMIPRSGPVIQDPFNHRSLIPSAYIDFPAGNASFDMKTTFTDVVNGTFPKGTFRGKIVFVGRTGQESARENYDLFTTAFTNYSAESLGSLGFVKTMPGVFLQALNLNALLRNGFITKAPIWSVWVLIFGLAVTGAAGVRASFNWRGPAILFLCTILYVGYSVIIFSRYNIYIPWLVPSLLMLASIIAVTYFERGALRRKWSRYVSPQVLEKIIKGEEEGAAQRYRASVLFGDIRGFTAFTTLHTPETVVKLLNAHFEKMTTIIYEEHGTIDKFMGDGVMAMFGAPVALPNNAECAVRAAWRMCEASKEPLFLDGESFVLSSGFGVTNGFLVAGHVGSKVRHDYTIIGDVVNIAARLSGVTNSSDVVIDSTTMRLVQDQFEVESLGELYIKGLPEHMECFKVVGMRQPTARKKGRAKLDRQVKTGIS